jgi:hypothetical protein
MMLFMGGQWGAPSGIGPERYGNGGQIYAQYSYGGPIELECQMPIADSACGCGVVAFFGGTTYLLCAGAVNFARNMKVYTRDYCTASWAPSTGWVSPVGTSTEIRSMLSYEDTTMTTPTSYLFVGSDDGSGNGGIFKARFNQSVPGSLVWDHPAPASNVPELTIGSTNVPSQTFVGSIATTGVMTVAYVNDIGTTTVKGSISPNMTLTGPGVPAATFTATITKAGNLTVTDVTSGTVMVGMSVSGAPGLPDGCTIATWNSTTLTGTVTPAPTYFVGGAGGAPEPMTGSCMITAQLTSSMPGNALGRAGTYQVSPAPTTAVPTGTTLTGSITLPQMLLLRVMSMCAGPNQAGGTSLYATIGLQVWERIDGNTPTWQLVWTKPTANGGETNQSGLRALSLWGTTEMVVFPEGTDWSMTTLAPGKVAGASWTSAVLYNIADFNTTLAASAFSAKYGGGFKADYLIGPYNHMTTVTCGSTNYQLIGLSVGLAQYPSATYKPYIAGQIQPPNTPFIFEAPYLVKNGTNWSFYVGTRQPNAQVACRFMVADSTKTYVYVGGPDYEMCQETVELGWIGCDTVANVVAGT